MSDDHGSHGRGGSPLPPGDVCAAAAIGEEDHDGGDVAMGEEPSSPSDNALVEAAMAAEALMAAIEPAKHEFPGSLDSVRHLKAASPEKKQ